MRTLTPKEKKRLHEKLDELFPEKDINYNDPSVLRSMMRDFWSSRIDRLTAKMRKLDQTQMEAAAQAWHMGVV